MQPTVFLYLVLALSSSAQGYAQETKKEPPLPAPGMPGKDVLRMMNRHPRQQGEAFEKLSAEDKAKVRKAMEKAWEKPEVNAARDRLMAANEEFRSTLRASLQSIDPDVVVILDKIRPEPSALAHESRPKPEDPNFAEVSIHRLSKELSMFAKPERREAMLTLHEQLIAKPELKTLIEELKKAAVSERVAAFRKLHQAYRTEVQSHFSEAWRERNAKSAEALKAKGE
jgi:anion-transporting  ArsA/GET3 family ATPase